MDSYTKKGIPGVSLSLPGGKLEGTTDADGMFRLSAPSGIPAKRSDGAELRSDGAGFFLTIEDRGFVEIGIHLPSGRRLESLFSGRLGPGCWRIEPPVLPAGLYWLRIRTSKRNFTCRYAVLDGRGRSRAGMQALTAFSSRPQGGIGATVKAAAAGEAADTLRVMKPGYFASRLPVADPNRKGWEILLTDTAQARAAAYLPDSSWACGMPGGIPPPARGTLLFRADLRMGAVHDFGDTQF